MIRIYICQSKHRLQQCLDSVAEQSQPPDGFYAAAGWALIHSPRRAGLVLRLLTWCLRRWNCIGFCPIWYFCTTNFSAGSAGLRSSRFRWTTKNYAHFRNLSDGISESLCWCRSLNPNDDARADPARMTEGILYSTFDSETHLLP